MLSRPSGLPLDRFEPESLVSEVWAPVGDASSPGTCSPRFSWRFSWRSRRSSRTNVRLHPGQLQLNISFGRSVSESNVSFQEWEYTRTPKRKNEKKRTVQLMPGEVF